MSCIYGIESIATPAECPGEPDLSDSDLGCEGGIFGRREERVLHKRLKRSIIVNMIDIK